MKDKKPSSSMPFEPERYELAESPFDFDRRLKIFGGGIVILVTIDEAPSAQESGRGRRRRGDPLPEELSAWLHIGNDGVVTVYTGKVEIGQNIRTSLAQAVADELRLPMESVQLVMGDTDRTPYDRGTFGSNSTPRMAPQLRRASATAREILIDFAAEQQVRRKSLQHPPRRQKSVNPTARLSSYCPSKTSPRALHRAPWWMVLPKTSLHSWRKCRATTS